MSMIFRTLDFLHVIYRPYTTEVGLYLPVPGGAENAGRENDGREIDGPMCRA